VFTYLAKLTSMYFFHVGDFLGWGGQSWIWGPGASLGYWSSSPSLETNNYAAFATGSMQCPFNGCWTLRCTGIGPGGVASIYKVARETKANLRDVLIGSLIICIIGVPVGFFSYTWFITHGGGITHTSSWGAWVQWWKYGFGVTGYGTGITGESNVWAPIPWHLLGMVIFFIFYALRMRFTWFFIDPFAFAFAGPYMDYSWLCAVVAVVIRVILIRAVGTTRFTKYVISIASGLIWGYSLLILLLWLVEYTVVVYPTFMSFYVP